ncbi:MAG: hypothetical protein ACLTZJ_07225 [Oscillospiraceae bacterium]
MLMPTVSDLQIFIYSMDMDPDPEWGGCAGSSQQTFLHALQMIPEQAAGCSKHDHQYREGKNDRLLRDAARFVLLDRLLRLHALGFRELDNFAHFGFFPVSCRSAGFRSSAVAGEMGFGSSPVSAALGKGACFLSYALQQERAA